MVPRPSPQPTPSFDQSPVVVTIPHRRSGQSGGVRTDAVQSHPLSGEKFLLTRTLQSELLRVGCYDREINGIWTTTSRMAMQMFLERVNAALPFDEPNVILLSLVQAHEGAACRKPCPGGQPHTDSCLFSTLSCHKVRAARRCARDVDPLVTGSLAHQYVNPTGPAIGARSYASAGQSSNHRCRPFQICAQDFAKLQARHGPARMR